MLLLSNDRSVGAHKIARGRLVAVRGPVLLATLPGASLGELCEIDLSSGAKIHCQIVSFENDLVTLAPLKEIQGVAPGNAVTSSNTQLRVKIPSRLGAIVDELGNTLNEPSQEIAPSMPIFNPPPAPLDRSPINERLVTGVKAIDCLCPIGYGQRLGLFAGPGVGKSTLLGMMARSALVDITVIALVGERGREVNEFIHIALGDEGLRRSIVVVATSDKPALARSLAAASATAIAEHYRAMGKRVLLLVDSLTRAVRAIREVGLAAGEIPVRQGLTPSVYSELPRLLERTGNSDKGSITAIYTLLEASEQENDALSDEVKSLLDGHIRLDSAIAASGIRPAIDFGSSISRVEESIATIDEKKRARTIRAIIGRLKKDRDIILLGGTPDSELKACLEIEPQLREFLHQDSKQLFEFEDSQAKCARIAGMFEKPLHQSMPKSLP